MNLRGLSFDPRDSLESLMDKLRQYKQRQDVVVRRTARGRGGRGPASDPVLGVLGLFPTQPEHTSSSLVKVWKTIEKYVSFQCENV